MLDKVSTQVRVQNVLRPDWYANICVRVVS
jgi:hypothetical protein